MKRDKMNKINKKTAKKVPFFARPEGPNPGEGEWAGIKTLIFAV